MDTLEKTERTPSDARAEIRTDWSRCLRESEVLTPAVMEFLASLHRRFGARRLDLLAERDRRQAAFNEGQLPDFLASTRRQRESDWSIEPVPADLRDRRVEITGPVDRKTIINALNTPVQAFMADFEDSTSPTWDNIVSGQINLRDAVARKITYRDSQNGKTYRLNDTIATLIVRPRGWHLVEKHVRIDGEAISGSLFDFGVFLVNNHEALDRNGTGPYFYLPKMESHLEARLWNDVFVFAEDTLGLRRGTIKATVLIETLPAAFEMDEILFELREHAAGLNCGRWDYIFSFIKKLRAHPQYILPDRGDVTMDRHFLKSYVDLLIRTCHRRGAHAMGGMAAQIPIRHNPAANDAAMAKVLADKQREVAAGHDGTWIAHPGLAPVAYRAFGEGYAPNQLNVKRLEVQVTAADLLSAPEGAITETGVRHNLRVALMYLAAWLDGRGCVPIYNLMEDAATAEICRAQVWQWIRHEARTSEGYLIDEQRADMWLSEELDKVRRRVLPEEFAEGTYNTAARVLSNLISDRQFSEFLTLPAYDMLA